jgi:hypothetical protein
MLMCGGEYSYIYGGILLVRLLDGSVCGGDNDWVEEILEEITIPPQYIKCP